MIEKALILLIKGKMDPDGDESAKLYKKLIEEKKRSVPEGNDKSESVLEGKEQRKLSATIIQVY